MSEWLIALLVWLWVIGVVVWNVWRNRDEFR